LLFEGYFEKLDEDGINLLMMAIVSEQRKDSGSARRVQDNQLRRILKAVEKEIESLRALEVLHGVAEVTQKIETSLATAMLAWSRGCHFEELQKYADLADGDFVRSFRLVIDFLRQTRRAMAGHTALLEKLDRCVAKINRDVVDAERQLRIGQESNLSHGGGHNTMEREADDGQEIDARTESVS
jgi:ATP-dependent RNA helicase DOB1